MNCGAIWLLLNLGLYFSHSMSPSFAVPFSKSVTALPYLIKYRPDTSCTNKKSSQVKGVYQPYQPVQYPIGGSIKLKIFIKLKLLYMAYESLGE